LIPFPEKTASRPFLATTALEEFWDTSGPIIFLGEWCCRFSRKEHWSGLGGNILESPWLERNENYRAGAYINQLYEQMLLQLTSALNAIHAQNYSERYWRIIVGPWLQLYLPIMYDRYIRLKNVLNQYPELITITLNRVEWKTPRDTLEFVEFCKDDIYNLQLFSRLLTLMGYDFPTKRAKIQNVLPKCTTTRPAIKKRLATMLVKGLRAVNRVSKDGRAIICRGSYFSWWVEIMLVIKTRGKVWPIIAEMTEFSEVISDRIARDALARVLIASNGFERLLNTALAEDLPQCFLENFTAIGKTAKECYPAHPKAIFSAVAWHYDESFKQWAAACADSGVTLIGMQHGGNYGSIAFHPSENHETAITDQYFTWGWRKSATTSRITPSYASKLSGRTPLGADNGMEGLLFICTSAPRYLFQFPVAPERFSDYLLWHKRFITAIHPGLLQAMRVRFHREDLGWDIADRWRAFYSGVTIERWDIPLRDSLKNCRLCVFDNLATTFLEALAANKPTILFWNPEINELLPEAQPFYDCLRETCILYDSPEDAARGVEAAYVDVETWWNMPVRQAARKSFCAQFARTSPSAVDEWAEEFKRIAAV
jgi:putative transferase (TIGR04331 family)